MLLVKNTGNSQQAGNEKRDGDMYGSSTGIFKPVGYPAGYRPSVIGEVDELIFLGEFGHG